MIASNAHVGATNNNGCGALQKALGHSLHVANILRRAGAPSTNRQGPWPRGRTSFMSVHVSIFIFLDNGSRALGAVKRGGFLVIVGARALGHDNSKIDKCTYVLSTSVRFPRNGRGADTRERERSAQGPLYAEPSKAPAAQSATGSVAVDVTLQAVAQRLHLWFAPNPAHTYVRNDLSFPSFVVWTPPQACN